MTRAGRTITPAWPAGPPAHPAARGPSRMVTPPLPWTLAPWDACLRRHERAPRGDPPGRRGQAHPWHAAAGPHRRRDGPAGDRPMKHDAARAGARAPATSGPCHRAGRDGHAGPLSSRTIHRPIRVTQGSLAATAYSRLTNRPLANSLHPPRGHGTPRRRRARPASGPVRRSPGQLPRTWSAIVPRPEPAPGGTSLGASSHTHQLTERNGPRMRILILANFSNNVAMSAAMGSATPGLTGTAERRWGWIFRAWLTAGLRW
jgi:hypothetical protein